MIITNQTASDYWFGPMHLPAGSGQQLTLDDTSDTSLYLLNDEVADAVNTLYLASNIAVSSAASPFPRATGTPSLLHGDGSPEGMVYAPQGSLYMRRDTVQASTSLYSKQTGITQNTGWASVIGPAAGDLVASAAPTREGCLLCDGTSYPTTSYPVLFAAIGTSYGSTGSGYFNVPDLRGRLPLGAGTGMGSGGTSWSVGQQPTSGAGGEQTHTLSPGEIPQPGAGGIEVAIDNTGGYMGSGTAANSIIWTGTVGTPTTAIASDRSVSNTWPTNLISLPGYGGGAHNTLPPVSVVNWFIVHG